MTCTDEQATKARRRTRRHRAPFVSHLIELRDRLIRALIAVGIAFGALACGPAPRLYDLLAAADGGAPARRAPS
jgi:Sec-independent protein secretion pathway component TatC